MSDITPIVNRTNCDLVAERIKELILNKQYPPGSRLPNEAELASMFQVGRSTMREALKGLQSAGILNSSAGRGTFVSEDALSCIQLSRFSKMIFSDGQAKELVELRYSIEPDMAHFAALRRKPKDIKEMQKCINAMKKTDSKNELLHYGNDFHRAVCKTTYNDLLIALYYSISMQLLKLRQMDFLTVEVYKGGIISHQEILDAIAASDAVRAEALMREHLSRRYGRFLD